MEMNEEIDFLYRALIGDVLQPERLAFAREIADSKVTLHRHSAHFLTP